MIQDFFNKLYYDNDILGLTGVNCFNYQKGQVDIKLLIETIQDNDLKIIVK